MYNKSTEQDHVFIDNVIKLLENTQIFMYELSPNWLT